MLTLAGCSAGSTPLSVNTAQPFIESTDEAYVKSVFIAYYELSELIADKTEEQFKNAVNTKLKELKEMGFNSVTVQVRAFADAFYKSDLFPVSKYCFGKEGGELKYDALNIICSQAEKNSIRVEAWVNPYRVSFDKDIDKLSNSNIAKTWYENVKKKQNVYICKSGIYFNPASDDVTALISNGVKEIVEGYNVSAICIDDYFYPDNSKEIDAVQYKKYLGKVKKCSLSDFRREKVSNMIKTVNKTIKGVNSNVKFIISPAANIKNDYEELYADVEKWAGDKAFCDYICPQIYFGFKNVYQPFMFTVKKWIGITDVGLCVALPLYKAGKSDKYAAEKDKGAINEFKNNDNIIARQVNYLAKLDDIKGIYIFSYSSLFEERCSRETENLIKALQGIHPL